MGARRVVSKRSYFWLTAVAGLLAALILAALLLRQSFGLTAFSDLVQCILLISAVASSSQPP